MEEDILNLRISVEEAKKTPNMYNKYIKSIENLINRVKELEEENQQLEAIKDEAIRRYNLESIPTSLVEETIEELNKEEQELQNRISDEEREEYSDANISFELMDIEIRRRVLQELLKGRK